MERTAGPYAPAVASGELLFCSGQLGMRDGVLVSGVEAEVTQALENLAGVLAVHGSGLADVVKTTVFLSNIGDLARVNAAYSAGFGRHRPARSAVAVAGLPLGASVEIEAIARLQIRT